MTGVLIGGIVGCLYSVGSAMYQVLCESKRVGGITWIAIIFWTVLFGAIGWALEGGVGSL